MHGLPDFIDNREIIKGSFITWIDNDLEFGPNCKDMFPSPIKNNSKHNSTSLCDKMNENPFSRNSKITRSPTIQSKTQLQQQLVGTPTKAEIVGSHVKEKVVSDTAIIEKLNTFEKLCASLQKQVDDLKLENQRLKDSLRSNAKDNDIPSDIKTTTVSEYCTDEEELAYETEWILRKDKRKKNPKKRKAESSPEMDVSVQSSKPVKETFKVSKTKDNEIAKKPKLPPVILSNINDFNKVQDVMTSQSIKYEIKLLNNKQLSIKVSSENDYRSLTKAINEAKFEWHSYENKATRPCKVIARGLHPTCNPEKISDNLKELGFNILSVVNLTKKKKVNDTQITDPLPLFMLTFDHSEDIKKVFSITHIVNTRVKIEAIKKQKEQIPQCRRCQRFEHTQSFCKREARCVKCAGSHLTINCIMDKKAPPKCSNCHEAHPANYRGCMVAKELQKRRLAKKKVDVSKPKQQKVPTPRLIKGVLYSDVTRKNTSGSANDPNQVKKPVTPKGNRNVKPNKLFGKNQTTPKRQKSPNKNITNEDSFLISMARMITKIDEISARLEKIENRYFSKHNGTPRSILKK